jgi:predicted transposase/invertase (TIGR01784 family)
MPKKIDHDQLFKQLLSTFFLDFLDLFVPELAINIDRDNLEFLPQEYFTDIVEGERRAMDLVVRVNLRHRPNEPEVGKVWAIINCEHQSNSQADFQRRLFFYFAQLHRKYLEPVYPIAIFSFDEPQRQEPDRYRVRLPGLDILEFNFLRIQLNQLNWRDFLKQKNPVAAALMSKMKIDKKDRAKVKVECLRSIATLKLDPARVSILSGFVDSYLNLNAVEEVEFEREVASIKKETEKEKVMQIVTSWMEQGIEQGRVEGGKEEALRLVSRVLIRRVGDLEATVNDRLQQLSVSQLEDLLDAALDFTQMGDLTGWLDAHG